jgi:peptide subunit release factor 1 (eRF1)
MKIERHIEDHIGNHFKNTVKRVEHIHDFENKSAWLILGQHDLVTNFLKHLPPALKSKVVGTFEMDLRSNVNDIAKVAENFIFAEGKKQKKEEIEDLNNLRSKGLFTWGITEVLKYVNNDAVEKLLISDNFNQPGYYCPKCDMLDINPCSCGNVSVKEINLAEALLQKIIKNEGEVEFLDSSDLQEYGDIAAKLRFAL